jgi:hypothetical protein
MDQTPNTVNYLIMGYAVLLGMPLLYLLSWRLRRRSLEKDLEVIQSLSETKDKDHK